MKDIDLKDRKIISTLDLNSRQSLSQIGRKIKVSKHLVSYRIKSLEQKGIIRNYYTTINFHMLGYNSIRIYIKFQSINLVKQKEIIEYFKNNKYTWVVASTEGRFDLVVVIWVRNIIDFYNFWEKSLFKFNKYLLKKEISFYIKVINFRPSYLLDKPEESNDIVFDTIGFEKIIEIDNFDYQLLKLISINARCPITHIAKKLNTNVRTAHNRIKKLINNKIITGFRINVDYIKLGYKWFKVDIFLNDFNQKKLIIDYLKTNPHLRCIDITTNSSDLELELHLKNTEHLRTIINNINKKYPSAIKYYEFLLVNNLYKLCYFPEE